MRWPADYHTHNALCRHAIGSPWQYAERAVAMGLEEIGCSDHSPMPQDDYDNWRMYERQLAGYVEAVLEARRRFPRLTIRLALEVDYIPGQEDWIRQLAARYPWDYFIGSVHYVANGWDVDNPYKLDEWKRRPVEAVWEEYLNRLEASIRSGLFDIIGHCDLPKKFGHRPQQDFLPRYREIFRVAAEANVAMEINTAGWRKDCREQYPARAILEAAHQAGVALVFGSDAHTPEEVGAGWAEAVELARAVGYTHWRRFSRRKAEPVAL
ncbi:histidinol-phosphatase HisJ family protein [Fontisphaera persica]|uniref:histidinol-phosphatase HisJ family protein n=1 Tax=Fontisphaera persica TaxID=2974023 RepID=UPI0024BFCF6C|nr:histidinol-phosphatase HisJ family protein [Fontisphaera persica]WCJ59196.1 histidinol-phosphatase HisJ family protein [Fontisphaera persica]